MLKLLFLPLLLITFFCFGQDSASIIGKPKKVGNLLVAQNDFKRKMNWEDSKAACDKLGKGWRLPTKDEMLFLFENQEKIIGLTESGYWSSEEYKLNVGFAWQTRIQSGEQYFTAKENNGLVRAVKSSATFISSVYIGQDSASIIGKPKKVGNLLVAQNDFKRKMNWEDSKAACDKLGKGWRLPTKDEMLFLYENQEKIIGLTDGSYWSSEEYKLDVRFAWKTRIQSGEQNFTAKENNGLVRAVKSL